MEKWTIKPAASAHDPRRHVLLIKGSMKDVQVLLKRFGAMCGRPSPASDPEGYNFSLFLHGLTESALERVKATLGELVGASAAAPALVPSPAPPAPPAAPTPPAPPPASLVKAVEVERFPAPALAPAPPVPTPVPAPVPAPIPAPAPAPTPEPAAVLIDLSHASPPAVPPIPEPPALPPPPPPAPAPSPKPSAPAVAVTPTREEPLFGLKAPVDAARTFESLAVGAYNRFAHAAATSVISSPGSMYNPLFLYGPAGVGKSHMAQAITHGLGGPLGKDNVVLTSGARMGRAVSTALAAKRFAEIETVLRKAKALVVDDLHLLAVTDQNTAAMAKLFAMFFASNLQVVLTSMYPPRALGALEEALRISFGKGWSVDLKVPNQNVQREIVHAQLDRWGLTMTNDEVGAFLERLGNNYGEAMTWIRRLVVMHRLSQQAGQNAKPEELMAIVFNPDPAPGGQEFPTAQQLESVRGFYPPAPGADALSLVLVIPKTQEHLREWAIARLYQAASQFRIQRTYRLVACETYDAQQPFGVPFLIADICRRSGARAALIIGPPADTQLAARLGEFSHAVGHLLESMSVRMAWVPHNGTLSASNFLRAQLDCLGDL